MGAHWQWLGYASVDALVEEARSGTAGQLRLMARFIDRSGLAGALRRRDWHAFARGYNGPAYARNAYHARLAEAHARYAAPVPVAGGTSAPLPVLRRGASGETVRALQAALTSAGHPTAVDGVFGAATEAALRAFQQARGLSIDGIAGPLTLAALDNPPPTVAAPTPAAQAAQGSGDLLGRFLLWLRGAAV